MGNSLRGSKTTAKVMKIDGTTLRLQSPAQAAAVLRDHPGHDLLDSDDVKKLGLRARPLDPDQHLKPGKLYFLLEIPKLPNPRAPRRTWSGAIHVNAGDRLEGLKLSRRSVSDLSLAAKPLHPESATAEQTGDGAVRLRMRLPKAQVAKLMEESKDAAEAANRIMELFVSRENAAARQPVATTHMRRRKETRTRFMVMADEVTV